MASHAMPLALRQPKCHPLYTSTCARWLLSSEHAQNNSQCARRLERLSATVGEGVWAPLFIAQCTVGRHEEHVDGARVILILGTSDRVGRIDYVSCSTSSNYRRRRSRQCDVVCVRACARSWYVGLYMHLNRVILSDIH